MSLSNKKLLNWLSLSGLLALVFYFLHIFLGVSRYPGYNWMEQAVSDLTAMDAPSFFIASGYSNLYGGLACICCIIVTVSIENKFNRIFRAGIYLYTIMHSVSFIGYTMFPLSGKGFQGAFTDIMHLYVVTLSVVLLSILSLILIFTGGIKHKQTKAVAVLALIALLVMFAGSIGTGVVPKEYFGLMERLSLFSVVIFTAVLGLFGYSLSHRADN